MSLGPGSLSAIVCDIDGVVVASPHERAWREALAGFAPPERFTTAFYQAVVAGRPRLDGALAALKGLGVADAERLAPDYAERKQQRIAALIEAGAFAAFADAVRFLEAARAQGLRLAAASSSRNATDMLARIGMPPSGRLLDLFDINVCGRPVTHGKPAPDLFLLAASELGVAAARCLVVEDAPSGILAARAAGMASIGVARLGDAALLRDAGADLVVTGLDGCAIAAIERISGVRP